VRSWGQVLFLAIQTGKPASWKSEGTFGTFYYFNLLFLHGKGIYDPEFIVDNLPVLHVFRVKDGTIALQCRCNNQAVPVGIGIFFH